MKTLHSSSLALATAALLLAMLSGPQVMAQEPEEHNVPIVLVKPELIDQLNASVHEMAAGQKAAYFIAVLPDGRALVVDKEGVEWQDIFLTGVGFQGLGEGKIQYNNSSLDGRLDGERSTTFWTCPTWGLGNRCCKSKVVDLLPQPTLETPSTGR